MCCSALSPQTPQWSSSASPAFISSVQCVCKLRFQKLAVYLQPTGSSRCPGDQIFERLRKGKLTLLRQLEEDPHRSFYWSWKNLDRLFDFRDGRTEWSRLNDVQAWRFFNELLQAVCEIEDRNQIWDTELIWLLFGQFVFLQTTKRRLNMSAVFTAASKTCQGCKCKNQSLHKRRMWRALGGWGDKQGTRAAHVLEHGICSNMKALADGDSGRAGS